MDVGLVNDRTGEFTKKLGAIEKVIQDTVAELGWRKNFSAFLLLLFGGIAVLIYLLHRDEHP